MATDPVPGAGRPLLSSRDGGFSLVEVLVAIAVIGTVMTAVAPFLVQSFAVVGQERGRQVAVQVANDALERARALDPSSLVAGRSQLETQAQWDAAPAVVAAYLADMDQAWDLLLPTATSQAGPRAPLPTVANPVAVNGVTYNQNWYVGRCWQGKVDPAATGVAAVGDCGPVNAAPGLLPYFRVVVAVTWPDASCAADQCVYLASTVVSTGVDPRFDLNRPSPTLTDLDNQTGYVTVATPGLQVLSSGGRLPLTWTSTGLPPGLTLTNSKITGTPTAAGTYSPVVKVTDRDNRSDDITFTWVVVTLPALTNPGTVTSRTGVALTRSIVETGGFAPFTWSATGLPAGLAIDPATGVISGTPTTVQTNAVTVTVVDKGAKTKSAAFSWRVLTPVQVVPAGPQSAAVDGSNSFSPTATGGLLPYKWTATNLPTGFTMNAATGALVGTVVAGSRYISTVTVTDAAGGVDSMTVVFTVGPNSTSDLRLTGPNPPDQNSVVGATVSLTAVAAGGVPAYAWAVSGLPTGLKLTAGVISGKLTTAGSYTVTVTVTDNASPKKSAKLMFVWKVT